MKCCFQSSEFGYFVLMLWFRPSYVLPDTERCFVFSMSVPTGATFKQICLLFGKAYSHSRVDLFGERT